MDKRPGRLLATATLLAVSGLASTEAMAQEAPAAESAVPAAPQACAKSSEIIYQPPPELIRLAAKRLNEQGRQYRRETVILATVGENGLVREVQIVSSSGHRLLDGAIGNWVRGRMYAPLDCGPADHYFSRIPVIVEGGTVP